LKKKGRTEKKNLSVSMGTPGPKKGKGEVLIFVAFPRGEGRYCAHLIPSRRGRGGCGGEREKRVLFFYLCRDLPVIAREGRGGTGRTSLIFIEREEKKRKKVLTRSTHTKRVYLPKKGRHLFVLMLKKDGVEIADRKKGAQS